MEKSKLVLTFLISLLSITPVSAPFAPILLDGGAGGATFIEDQTYSIISQFSGVIFIIIFVIILLVIGGVIKMPRGGGISLGWLGFIILIILLFVIPQFVPFPAYLTVPENFKIYPLPSYVASVFEILGLPHEWMYVPAIIYLFILPFAAIYTLVWAFLQSLTIFTNVSPSINRVLAFIITFLTIPIGWFVKIVWVLFSFMGIWSVVVFAATFIVGVFFRGYGVARKEYVEAKKKTAEFLKYKEIVNERIRGTLSSLLGGIDKLDPSSIIATVNDIAAQFKGVFPDIENWAAQITAAPSDKVKEVAKKATEELLKKLR